MKGKDDQLNSVQGGVVRARSCRRGRHIGAIKQGQDRNVFHLVDCISAFIIKHKKWQRNISGGNAVIFETLSSILDENEEDHLLYPSLKAEIIQHLKSMENKLKNVLPQYRREGVTGKESFLCQF